MNRFCAMWPYRCTTNFYYKLKRLPLDDIKFQGNEAVVYKAKLDLSVLTDMINKLFYLFFVSF